MSKCVLYISNLYHMLVFFVIAKFLEEFCVILAVYPSLNNGVFFGFVLTYMPCASIPCHPSYSPRHCSDPSLTYHQVQSFNPGSIHHGHSVTGQSWGRSRDCGLSGQPLWFLSSAWEFTNYPAPGVRLSNLGLIVLWAEDVPLAVVMTQFGSLFFLFGKKKLC